MAQWYQAGGTPLGGAFEVNSTSKNAQRYSAVAMDAQGDFVVTWESRGQDGSGYGVYAQRYDYARQSNVLDPTIAPIAPIGGTNELDVLSFTASNVQFNLTWNGKTTGPSPITYAGKADKTFTDSVQAAMAGIGADVIVSVIDGTDFGIEFVGAQGSQKQTSLVAIDPATGNASSEPAWRRALRGRRASSSSTPPRPTIRCSPRSP